MGKRKAGIVNEKIGFRPGVDEIYAPEFASAPDLAPGRVKHVLVALSATPNTVMTLNNVPAWAAYMDVHAVTGIAVVTLCNAEVTADPGFDGANAGTANAIDLNAASPSGAEVGAEVPANTRVTFTLPDDVTSIKLISGTASCNIWVTFRAG